MYGYIGAGGQEQEGEVEKRIIHIVDGLVVGWGWLDGRGEGWMVVVRGGWSW
jgi:hypothetical protein